MVMSTSMAVEIDLSEIPLPSRSEKAVVNLDEELIEAAQKYREAVEEAKAITIRALERDLKRSDDTIEKMKIEAEITRIKDIGIVNIFGEPVKPEKDEGKYDKLFEGVWIRENQDLVIAKTDLGLGMRWRSYSSTDYFIDGNTVVFSFNWQDSVMTVELVGKDLAIIKEYKGAASNGFSESMTLLSPTQTFSNCNRK